MNNASRTIVLNMRHQIFQVDPLVGVIKVRLLSQMTKAKFILQHTTENQHFDYRTKMFAYFVKLFLRNVNQLANSFFQFAD